MSIIAKKCLISVTRGVNFPFSLARIDKHKKASLAKNGTKVVFSNNTAYDSINDNTYICTENSKGFNQLNECIIRYQHQRIRYYKIQPSMASFHVLMSHIDSKSDIG